MWDLDEYWGIMTGDEINFDLAYALYDGNYTTLNQSIYDDTYI